MSYDFNRGDTMNEIITTEVENLIYEIRGKQVMLDSDLAKLYQCKNGTKEKNKAVKNNIDKFPERFSWISTDEESKIFLVNNFDRKIETRGGRFKNPRVFTEQGVAMLATILKSKVATEVSIKIMDAFVKMRHYIIKENYRLNNIETKLLEHDTKINEIFNQFKTNNNYIFFEGEIYDAYSLLIDILKEAEKEIIIIDNYAGKQLFDILKEIKINIKVVTKNIDEISYKKHKKQYENIEMINNDKFHDRFIIIDKKILYHSGASFKDIGKKCFGINKIEDKIILNDILKKL